jgi:AcrR family transcriptional regulator
MNQSTTTAKGELAIISILLSAERLFLSHGYNGTSMRDIAEGAGYRSVAGIYNHFREKEDILVALLGARSPLDSLTQLIHSTKGEHLAEFLPNVFQASSEFLSRNSGFLQLVLIDYFEFKGKHLSNLLPAYERLLQTLVERLMVLPDHPQQKSPLLLARLLQAQVVGFVMTQALVPPSWADQADWKLDLIEMIVTGLVPKE